ncbi:tRNA (guanosine(46)-N7)-methyltransferase TrmB [Methyloligella sp. 2.7D]|uniref:tRNA (guanosine(46)-N7)-methyltransferase TrmB n=1 Tax=unclassified Methyloligella TaxID=2625955 RepID=UPI001FEEFFF2|nr:tRNA (guanosine(46)-N7)-methyltransferase TrmB [Methyloligella sp. GL2]
MAEDQPVLRSYGRRKGHKLTAYKASLMETRLPALRLPLQAPAPESLAALFPSGADQVWLEIGFGGGEHLAWQAEHNPKTGLIGCEPFFNGVASLLAQAEAKGLDNIRLQDGDAREVLAWLPEGAIDRVFMLFPDPWPKTRHKKRRLLNEETASEIARVLKPGGEFRFASDWPDYVAQALGILHKHPGFSWNAARAADWRERPDDWPETRYEQKAVREGRKSAYLSFRRV